VQSCVVGTRGVARIDDVAAFRRAGVSFALLRCEATLAESDFTGANHLAASKEFHDMIFLQDEDGISLIGVGAC